MDYFILFFMGFVIGLAWRKREPSYSPRYFTKDE